MIGMAFLVLLILGIATILSIILAAVINYRQHLRTQGGCIEYVAVNRTLGMGAQMGPCSIYCPPIHRTAHS